MTDFDQIIYSISSKLQIVSCKLHKPTMLHLKIFGIGLFLLLLCPLSASAYRDIVTDDPLHEKIQHLQDIGVMRGFSDDTFRPGAALTRAEGLAIALRAGSVTIFPDRETTTFSDVRVGGWFMPFVARAQQLGILNPEDSFHPHHRITKESFLHFLLSAAPSAGAEKTSTSAFFAADISTENPFRPLWAYAEKYQLLQKDSENRFNPHHFITRAEAAKMTYQQLRIFHGDESVRDITELQAAIDRFLQYISQQQTAEAQMVLGNILVVTEGIVRTQYGKDAKAAKILSKSMRHLVEGLQGYQFGDDLYALERLHLSYQQAKKVQEKNSSLGEFAKEIALVIEQISSPGVLYNY